MARVTSSTLRNNRQREQLQIEPADSFGVFGMQAMPFDAVLSEFATASAQLAFAETGQRRTPITVRPSTANGLG
jgi:hypothetical protein